MLKAEMISSEKENPADGPKATKKLSVEQGIQVANETLYAYMICTYLSILYSWRIENFIAILTSFLLNCYSPLK